MPNETRDFIQVPSDRSSRPAAATVERPREPPHTPEVSRRVVDFSDHHLAVAHYLDRRAPRFEIQREIQVAEMHDLMVAVKPALLRKPPGELSVRQRRKKRHHADRQRAV